MKLTYFCSQLAAGNMALHVLVSDKFVAAAAPLPTSRDRNVDEGPVTIPVNDHGAAHLSLLGTRLFQHCLEDDKLCDVTITVGHKSFKAHKAVLAAGSDYFRAMFSGGFREQHRSDVNIDGKSWIFECLLEFIYTGNFHVTTGKALDVLEMANYLQITHASAVCADNLVQELSNSDTTCVITFDDLARIMSCASNVITVTPPHAQLLNAAKSYITTHLSTICKHEDFAAEVPVEILMLVLDNGEDLARVFTEDEVTYTFNYKI